MDSGIYCIKNLRNGKVYVGSSVNITRRGKAHFWALAKGVHINSYLQRAYDKYGREAFEITVLEYVNADQLATREEFWINSLDSSVRASGYNLAVYANGRQIITEQAKINMSIAQRNRLPHSEETRRKMKESHLGLKHKPMSELGRLNIKKAMAPRKGVALSEETRRKMSIARTPSPKKGKPMSLEQRHKLSIAHKGIARPYRFRPVVQIDPDNGIIAFFPSLKSARAKTGANNIGQVCAGKGETSKGFVWQYA